VNIVDAGADNTGSEPIDGVLDSVVTDGTTVVFPPGTYLMERELVKDNARNVGLVGTAGSAETTIRIEETFADANIFDFGTSGGVAAEGITFKGFTVDMTAPGAGAGVFWSYCRDDCHFEDVVIDGVVEGPHPAGKGEILVRMDIVNPDGTGVMKNLSAPHGSRYAGTGNPFTGIYVGGGHAGAITIEDCEISGVQDNGVYTSGAVQAGGYVNIRGGRYANNDVSNVRIGGATSLVENVTIVQNSTDGMIFETPRGIYARNGSCLVRNVDISYDTDDENAILVSSSPASRTVKFKNVNIRGSAAGKSAVRIVGQTDCELDTVDVRQSGTNRDGIRFESSTGTVRNSSIDVTGSAIVTDRSNVEFVDVTVQSSSQ